MNTNNKENKKQNDDSENLIELMLKGYAQTSNTISVIDGNGLKAMTLTQTDPRFPIQVQEQIKPIFLSDEDIIEN